MFVLLIGISSGGHLRRIDKGDLRRATLSLFLFAVIGYLNLDQLFSERLSSLLFVLLGQPKRTVFFARIHK